MELRETLGSFRGRVQDYCGLDLAEIPRATWHAVGSGVCGSIAVSMGPSHLSLIIHTKENVWIKYNDDGQVSCLPTVAGVSLIGDIEAIQEVNVAFPCKSTRRTVPSPVLEDAYLQGILAGLKAGKYSLID